MRRYIIFPDRTSSAAHIFMPWPYNIDVYQEMIIPPVICTKFKQNRHGESGGGRDTLQIFLAENTEFVQKSELAN